MSHAYRLKEAGVRDANMDFWIVPDAPHADAFLTYTAEYTQRMLAFYDKFLH